MTNQRINDVDTITTISSTDRILVNTDTVNNILEQIEKDDFVADIISADANNLIDIGTDNKLAVIDSTITLQGNTFNGNSQLIQTTAAGKYPALDGSLITNVSVFIDKNITQLGTCSTAAATAEKSVTLSGFSLSAGATILVKFTNANTATTPTLNVNGTGTKAIYNTKNAQFTTGNTFDNKANETCLFTYDGTNWVLITTPFYVARMASISSTYESYSYVADETHTAPADGVVEFSTGYASTTGILVNNTTGIVISVYAGGAAAPGLTLPVSKNDVFLARNQGSLGSPRYRFYYAKGAV